VLAFDFVDRLWKGLIGFRKLEARSEKMTEALQYYGTGRRKSAIARVYLRPGSVDFKVNGKAFDQ